MIAKRTSDRPRIMYFPGKTPGQPYKLNTKRVCYHITKPEFEGGGLTGDRFDMFLSNADKRINYWETGFARRKNPWNPYDMLAEFNINVVDEGRIGQAREDYRRKFGVKADELITLEGCENDDMTFLGGKDGFISHFCTYFP